MSEKLDAEKVKSLANLARINIDDAIIGEVASSISSIISFVDQLQAADTSQVEPMAHPLNAKQRLRKDEITEENQRDLMHTIAPVVENGLYLVPSVID